MSFLDKITQQKPKLAHTETVVSMVSGDVMKEMRSSDGRVSSVKMPFRSAGFVVDTKPDLRVDKITDWLYLGSQDVIQDHKLLKDHNIRHVLSIGVKVFDQFCKDINYVYIDALDVPEFDMSFVFDSSYEIIHSAVCKHEKVYVHCNAGVSRSASVVIAYLMKSDRVSFRDAYEHVKKCRSVIKPNDGFIKQLKLYENYLNKTV